MSRVRTEKEEKSGIHSKEGAQKRGRGGGKEMKKDSEGSKRSKTVERGVVF